MKLILLYVLKKSLIAILFVLCILLVRRITRGYSKVYVKLLWIALIAELLLPMMWHRPAILVLDVPVRVEIRDEGTENEQQLGTDTEFRPSAEQWATEWVSGAATAEKTDWGKILFWVWAAGMFAMSVYSIIGYLRLRKSLKTAIRSEQGVWLCENILVPFVLPGLPSRIYLPYELTEGEQEAVLLHERQHIRNGDPWLKCAALCARIVHWFNPFVWLAFHLFDQDLEMYCDEQVTRHQSLMEKKQYTSTLLAFSSRASRIEPLLYFGEQPTQARVKHVLFRKGMKRPMVVLLSVLAASGIIFFIGWGTQSKDTPPEITAPTGEIQREYVFYQGNLYVYQSSGTQTLPEGCELVGEILAVDNTKLPAEELHASRLSVGREVYSVGERGELYVDMGDFYGRFKVEQMTQMEDSPSKLEESNTEAGGTQPEPSQAEVMLSAHLVSDIRFRNTGFLEGIEQYANSIGTSVQIEAVCYMDEEEALLFAYFGRTGYLHVQRTADSWSVTETAAISNEEELPQDTSVLKQIVSALVQKNSDRYLVDANRIDEAIAEVKAGMFEIPLYMGEINEEEKGVMMGQWFFELPDTALDELVSSALLAYNPFDFTGVLVPVKVVQSEGAKQSIYAKMFMVYRDGMWRRELDAFSAEALWK